MDEFTLRTLESRRVAWKFEWESLLRREPSVSALGNPDTLVFKMDETISTLLALLRKHHVGAGKRSVSLVPLERHYACRMNPLSKFYATGEVALRSMGHGLPARDIETAIARFRLYGLDEIESLCAVCQNRLRPGYPAVGSMDWASRCGAYRG